MTYEVYLPGYGTLMKTDSVRCVDDEDTLNRLSNSGHKFKVNGKIVAKSNVHQAVADALGISVKDVKSQIKDQKDFSDEMEKAAHDRFVEEKVRERLLEQPKTEPEQHSPKRKVTRIKCVELGTIYKNMTEAGKALGIDPAYISDAVRLNKPTKGYHFERVEE